MLELLITVPFQQARERVMRACGHTHIDGPITADSSQPETWTKQCKTKARLEASLARYMLALQRANTKLESTFPSTL